MELMPGDIYATKGAGVAGWAVRNLISPSTDRFHFGILWKRLPDDDFIILESMNLGVFPKGLCIGRLLQYYDLNKLEFYRVNCPVSLRSRAAWGLIDWGRSKYDFMLILKVAFGGLLAFFKILITEHKIRRLRAEDFPYGVNSSPICTEAVDIAYDSVGVNVIPIGVLPIPNSFKQAEAEGRMSKLTE